MSDEKEIAGPNYEHKIRNDLQVILWGLHVESGEEGRRSAKKALQSILNTLEGVNISCK